MLRTPEQLTKEFGISPEAGQGRAVPRALLGYSGAGKARFLGTTISLIMNGALPEYGQKLKWAKDITQSDLAESASIARETFTRWLSEFATPDDSWNVERRLEQRRRARARHQLRGHKLHERERSVREHQETLIARRRRFMKPNRYSYAFPGHQNHKRPADWFPPTPAEAHEHEILQRFFGRLAEGGKGFKHLPLWLWSPKLPLSLKARLVMSYYFMCGLGSKDRKSGKVIGTVRPMQTTVAEAVGLKCVKSVFNANLELAAVGLIRVAHERIQCKDGTWRRGRQIIIYLPIRQLSEEEATAERERLQTMLAVARATQGAAAGGWMASRVKELHDALLREWTGKEHCLRAFWNQVRRSAIAEGIHLRLINSLIPSPPE